MNKNEFATSIILLGIAIALAGFSVVSVAVLSLRFAIFLLGVGGFAVLVLVALIKNGVKQESDVDDRTLSTWKKLSVGAVCFFFIEVAAFMYAAHIVGINTIVIVSSFTVVAALCFLMCAITLSVKTKEDNADTT